MANELNIVLAESGATVTCQPYQAGAAVGSPISLTEIGTSAVYTGNMTGSAGTYLLAFHDATENVGVGSIVWSGTAEVPVSTLTAAQVNAEADTALADVGLTTTITSRIDAAISTRATPANIPTADITAIKAKTDALNTTRLAQCSTTEIVGNLLAQANS